MLRKNRGKLTVDSRHPNKSDLKSRILNSTSTSGSLSGGSNSIKKANYGSALSSYSKVARRAMLKSMSINNNYFRMHKMAASADISLPFWPNSGDDYKLKQVIGVGATAVVYSAYCKPRNEKCAIKIINLEKWKTSMEELLIEIQAMSSCNHENVVTYYTSFVVKHELWLILKLLEGGSLLDVIKYKIIVTNCKHGVFDEATIATVLREVLKGLEYFHSNGQIHRDIKAGNILLGEDGNVQIADFGVSAWLSTGKDMSRQKVRHTFVGTPCWMAPEVIQQDHGYDFKADIWSFGITAIEMATGSAPYHKYSPMKVLLLTLQNDPPNLETGAEVKDQYKAYGKTFRQLVFDCLQKDPSNRPTATELLKHPFFKKAKDKTYLTETLLAIGPSIETRINKASKSSSGTSSCLHRTMTGESVWSEEENENIDCGNQHSDDDDNASPAEERRPMNQLRKADSSASDNDEEVPEKGRPVKEAAMGAAPMPQKPPEKELVTVNLVLRIRNSHGELNDIKFEYVIGKDSAEDIADEIESAGLIDPNNSVPISVNLDKLLNSREVLCQQGLPNVITFCLNSAGPAKQFDKEMLIGFAQLSIVQ